MSNPRSNLPRFFLLGAQHSLPSVSPLGPRCATARHHPAAATVPTPLFLHPVHGTDPPHRPAARGGAVPLLVRRRGAPTTRSVSRDLAPSLVRYPAGLRR